MDHPIKTFTEESVNAFYLLLLACQNSELESIRVKMACSEVFNDILNKNTNGK